MKRIPLEKRINEMFQSGEYIPQIAKKIAKFVQNNYRRRKYKDTKKVKISSHRIIETMFTNGNKGFICSKCLASETSINKFKLGCK